MEIQTQTPIFECRNISKTFPGVVALDHMSMKVMPGEIHGLVGENGAGKSTLIKIMSGVYTCDEPPKGTEPEEHGLFMNGQKVHIRDVHSAHANKIQTIHQELNIVPDLTVFENIYINNYEGKKTGPLLNMKKMRREAEGMLSMYGADFHAGDNAGTLTADRKKLIEVIRAVMLDANLLILDEPTSMLTAAEAARLFETMRTVAAKGIGVIFISHNLNEIVEMCQAITVMRDGKLVDNIDNSSHDTSIDDVIIPLMVGYKVERAPEHVSSRTDEILLETENLCFKSHLKNVNLTLHKGEVIGITGLVGAGGRQLARTLFGFSDNLKDGGEILIKGKPAEIKSPVDAYALNMAYLTEDRKNEGLFLDFDITTNVVMSALKKFYNKAGMVLNKKREETALKYVDMLHIKTPGIHTVTNSLSGGNQQKEVVAKMLETEPEILILAEPTVGIDVAAKKEIRDIIKDLVRMGKGVILITNEYVELKELCDRLYIMFNGEIIKELSQDEMTEELVMRYALGGTTDGE